MTILKTLAVARWEYFEKIKTKAFIISMVITPLIIIAFAVLPSMLSQQEDESTKIIGIIDPTQNYFQELRNELSKYKFKDDQPNFVLQNLYNSSLKFEDMKKIADKKVFDGKIQGYILILNPKTDSLKFEFRSKSIGSFSDLNKLENELNNIRIKNYLTSAGLSQNIREIVNNNSELVQIIIEEDGKESSSDFMVVFFSSFIFIILLMMMVIYSGQMLVRSLVEEKANRLIEILISSCTPEDLLTGKILGLSLLGLTQLFIWALIGITLAGAAVIPYTAFDNVLPMLIYFILGFLLYTTIFVGVGSIVSTEQEAQQVTSYLSLIMMLPVVIAVPAIQNPDTLLVKILSFFPLTTPSIMLLRLNISEISIPEILLTISILILSIVFMIYISSKIFRIGILSYGKRPSLKDISRWIKEK